MYVENMKKYVRSMERYQQDGPKLSSLYSLWDFEKFQALPSKYSLFTLRKPKINKAKRDMKHVFIAGSVTGIFKSQTLCGKGRLIF